MHTTHRQTTRGQAPPFSRRLFGLAVVVAALACLWPWPRALPRAEAAQAAPPIIYAEEFPPFSYTEDGRLRGLAVDIVRALFAEAGLGDGPPVMEAVPWTRAFDTTLAIENTGVLCMVKTPERAPLFQWVGPTCSMSFGIITLADGGPDVAAPADLRSLRLGVLRNGAAVNRMAGLGVPPERMEEAGTEAQMVRMLYARRVDALATSVDTALYAIRTLGLDASRIRVPLVLDRFDLYLALNIHTAEATVRALREALARMLCNGGTPGASALHRLAGAHEGPLPPGALPSETPCPAAAPARQAH